MCQATAHEREWQHDRQPVSLSIGSWDTTDIQYIYYDGSSGPGGDFMRTNASGWSTGSYDFAEMFPSTESLEPGDVVVFGVDVTHVRRSVEHSDSHIAGVVSTRPGFLAGENTPGQYPIALAGRVPTKISLENGPIQVGDAITTSSRVGFAMKANKNGTIVGYALEPYTQTTTSEKIIVFVRPGYTGTIEVQPLIGSDNRASQLSSASNFTQLNMSGDIFMTSYSILGVGRIAGLGDVWSIEQDGTIKTASLLKNVIQSYTGEKVETTAMTSPDALITLIGTARTKEGIAEVRFEEIDPRFNDVVSAIAPMRVFLTSCANATVRFRAIRTDSLFSRSGLQVIRNSIGWLLDIEKDMNQRKKWMRTCK